MASDVMIGNSGDDCERAPRRDLGRNWLTMVLVAVEVGGNIGAGRLESAVDGISVLRGRFFLRARSAVDGN